MSNSRTNRKEIAKETLRIIESGWYQTPSGEKVSIREMQQLAYEGSIDYESDGFSEVLAKVAELRGGHETVFEVANETTYAASRRLLNEGAEEVVCLNFASAKNPGGGFLNGSQAQEEALCRASGLYPCLEKFMDTYYAVNRRNGSCIYTDHLMYTPSVPVFRDDEDVLVAPVIPVSVVTSPAVNAGAIKSRERSHVDSAMILRTRKVLAVMAAHGHRNIVLGAWGCGVFRNDPANVAGYFAQLLGEGGEFEGVFAKVAFGVLDREKSERTLKPFLNVFAGAASIA